jgi:hypothetical protein
MTSFQGSAKFTQIGIFGLKVYHLAALIPIAFCPTQIYCKDSCIQGCKMVYLYYPPPSWYILVGLGIDNVGTFIAIWYILWSFGKLYVCWFILWSLLYIFVRFGMLYQEQSGNPALLVEGRPILVPVFESRAKFDPSDHAAFAGRKTRHPLAEKNGRRYFIVCANFFLLYQIVYFLPPWAFLGKRTALIFLCFMYAGFAAIDNVGSKEKLLGKNLTKKKIVFVFVRLTMFDNFLCLENNMLSCTF